MASIDGLGSGLDTTTLISQLMSIEKLPQQRLAAQRQVVLTRSTAWNAINTEMTKLQDSLTKLAAGGLKAASVSSSRPDAATAAVTAGATPLPGAHELKVLGLATTQMSSSGPVDPTADLGVNQLVMSKGLAGLSSGTVTVGPSASGVYDVVVDQSGTLQVTKNGVATTALNLTSTSGTWTPGATATVVVAGTTTGQTVSDLRDVVNATNGPLKAMLVTSSTGNAHLVLTGSATGSANHFDIASSYAHASLHNAAFTGTDDRAAADASMELNGIAVSATSNTVSDLIPGVTLSLVATGDPTTVTISEDVESSIAAVRAMVDGLNGVLGQVKKHSMFDAATGKTGPLTGDGTARRLSSQLLDTAYAAVTTAQDTDPSLPTLSALGIKLEKDGTYSFDAETFRAQLVDNRQRAETVVGAVATELKTLVGRMMAPDGLLPDAKQGVTELAARLQKQVDAWDGRLALVEARLKKQFAQLEGALGGLKNQGTWLAGQLSQLS